MSASSHPPAVPESVSGIASGVTSGVASGVTSGIASDSILAAGSVTEVSPVVEGDQAAGSSSNSFEEVNVEAVDEILEDFVTGVTQPCNACQPSRAIGQCKWFNPTLGYGFLTICSGPDKGRDVFVHHSGIRPTNSHYKTLWKGEYVSFMLTAGPNGPQATHVTGVCGGSLMCDVIPARHESSQQQQQQQHQTISYAPQHPNHAHMNYSNLNSYSSYPNSNYSNNYPNYRVQHPFHSQHQRQHVYFQH